MSASQLIYTGCGKDKTGAFSVWSKTLDITKAEENEIRDKMLYKRPANLPFEPTQEELDTLFPRKFGYFNLTSGRVCLAQSVYIGNVYSDLDKRTGNYIIHAFVFDGDEDLIPMNFIESGLFKRGLTYEEWHDMDAPAELPRIEMDQKPAPLTKQEVDSFFHEERVKRLKLLLQAIVNAFDSDQKITFHDVHLNLKYWYKAISVCLPKHMQKTLTFSTFFTPGNPLPSQSQGNMGGINTEVKIRNISPTVASAVFSYQQDVRAGRYSFDFESGVIPANIEVTPYVQTVVETLKSNIFQAIMLVDSVGKISVKCGVDLNTALELHYLLNRDIVKVDDIAKLKGLIPYIAEHYSGSLSEIADSLYEYGLKSGKWKLSAELAPVYRFVFDYSKAADKGELINKYVQNQSAFGVDTTASGEQYSASFQKCAPFAWVNFLHYLMTSATYQQYLTVNGTGFNSRFLVFDTFVGFLTEISAVQEQKKGVLTFFADTAKYYIQKEQVSETAALVRCMGQCGEKWQKWLVEAALVSLAGDGNSLSDGCRSEYLLNLSEALGNGGAANYVMARLIRENEKDMGFIKLYVEHEDRTPDFYKGLLAALNARTEYSFFLRQTALYRFAEAPFVTKAALQEYYDDYVVTGEDSGLFAKKLKQYLSDFHDKECIKECLYCYDIWLREKRLSPEVMSAAVGSVCSAFFSVSMETLRTYIEAKGNRIISEMLNRASEQFRAPYHYYVLTFGESVRKTVDEIRSEKNSPLIDEVLNQLYNGSFYQIPTGEKAQDLFSRLYLKDTIALYFGLADASNFDEVYSRLFVPLYNCERFGRYFVEELEQLSNKEYDVFFKDTVVVSCGKSNPFSEYLLPIVEGVLDEMGRSKRKKLFSDLLHERKGKYEMSIRAFIDRYEKKNEGFFNKLFGSKGKKDEEEEDSSSDSRKKRK